MREDGETGGREGMRLGEEKHLTSAGPPHPAAIRMRTEEYWEPRPFWRQGCLWPSAAGAFGPLASALPVLWSSCVRVSLPSPTTDGLTSPVLSSWPTEVMLPL